MNMNLPLLFLGFGIFSLGAFAIIFKRLINMPMVILFGIASLVTWAAIYKPDEINIRGFTLRSSSIKTPHEDLRIKK